MTDIWHSLLANLALVSILVVAWDLVADFTGRLSRRMQSLLVGVVMCVGAATRRSGIRRIVLIRSSPASWQASTERRFVVNRASGPTFVMGGVTMASICRILT